MTEPSGDILGQFIPTGVLRASINWGNPILAQRDGNTGELTGASVLLARDLAKSLKVELELVPFDTAGKAFEALSSGECDVGFLAIDPVRGEQIDYTEPYVTIHGGYLVKDEAPFHVVADVDRDGVRIAAGRNTAYDLFLRRELKQASLVYVTTSVETTGMLTRGEADVAAGIRQPLEDIARRRPEFRMVEGNFMSIHQAMAMPKGRAAAMTYLRRFITDMKGTRTLADALRKGGHG